MRLGGIPPWNMAVQGVQAPGPTPGPWPDPFSLPSNSHWYSARASAHQPAVQAHTQLPQTASQKGKPRKWAPEAPEAVSGLFGEGIWGPGAQSVVLVDKNPMALSLSTLPHPVGCGMAGGESEGGPLKQGSHTRYPSCPDLKVILISINFCKPRGS